MLAKIAPAVLAFILCSTCCFALMEALSTEALTKGSELVIQGTVVQVESRWSRNREIIFTSAAVRVIRVLAGPCPATTITVEYPGGEVDGIGLGVSDQPRLTAGEDVILFLQPAKSHEGSFRTRVYAVYGAAQGKYTLHADGQAVKGGFSMMKNPAAPVSVDSDIPVDDLIKKIRQYR